MVTGTGILNTHSILITFCLAALTVHLFFYIFYVFQDCGYQSAYQCGSRQTDVPLIARETVRPRISFDERPFPHVTVREREEHLTESLSALYVSKDESRGTSSSLPVQAGGSYDGYDDDDDDDDDDNDDDNENENEDTNGSQGPFH